MNWMMPTAATVAVLCTACGARTPATLPPTQAATPPYAASSPGTYIKHIVVIVQENRSFENIFAGWPGADAPTYGYLHTGKRVALHSMTYADDCVRIDSYQYCDIGHLWQQALLGWDHGKMNGFDVNGYGAFGTGPPVHEHPYAYLDHAEIEPYRALASQYVLADHMFPTEFGTSFTAHQDLIAGTTRVDAATHWSTFRFPRRLGAVAPPKAPRPRWSIVSERSTTTAHSHAWTTIRHWPTRSTRLECHGNTTRHRWATRPAGCGRRSAQSKTSTRARIGSAI
jgi:hypothetical protein